MLTANCKPITFYTCPDRRCGSRHVTEEEARTCCPIRAGTEYICAVCGWHYGHKEDAKGCCTLEYLEERLQVYQNTLRCTTYMCEFVAGHIAYYEKLLARYKELFNVTTN